MSEQEQISQLSALFDGELPSEQAGLVIRRALKDPAMRASWGRYALIGACLRGEPLAGTMPQSDLAERVRAELVSEPDHTAEMAGHHAASASTMRRRALLGRWATGGAIAASVALVSLFIVRSVGPSIPAQVTPVQVAQETPAVPVDALLQADGQLVAQASNSARPAQTQDSLPPSYTTPVDNSPATQGSPLMNYVALHSEVAVSAVRLGPISSMVSEGYDPTRGAVDMTADEVGARH